MKVNILGTEYRIDVVSPTETMNKNSYVGMCSSFDKVITIADLKQMSEFEDLTDKEIENATAETMRHEIIHAFFNECGLKDDANTYDGPWCKNEELIDWIAIQGPKIVMAWKEAGCLG